MPGHKEIAFESAIEHHLLTAGGYVKGDPAAFDSARALDPVAFLAFVKETQPKEWASLENVQKEKAGETLLKDLCAALDSDAEGCLKVLRHGFKCFGRLFRAAWFAPASGLNPEILRLYAANRLAVTRQLKYSDKHLPAPSSTRQAGGGTLDLAISLNGIPVATAELKNPMTGQTWRDAVRQYKSDRDPNDLFFRFKKRTLDVLGNYTTYKTYYRLIKSIEEDPRVEKRKAARALARFMSLHPHNIAQKTEVMLEHFWNFTRHKIGGRAKAMVVTSSRLHAVRYKQAFDRYIAEKGYTGIKTLVAFSGKVVDPDIPGEAFTETGMNRGIREKELPERFASDEYQVLLVAEKYQTGFDQPFLHTMYVDKRLAGLQAVQTLSRLNRTHPGKDDTFILDFVNEREEFCRVFYKPKRSSSPDDHARMNACIDPAVKRFGLLERKDQEAYRNLLVAYRNLYAFLSQVIPFQDTDLEKLYTFVRFLLRKLPRGGRTEYRFDDDVSLKYYRLQKISEGAIVLQKGVGAPVSGPVDVGTGEDHDDRIELSKLIDILNDRFGTEFKPGDQLFFESIRGDALGDSRLRQAAQVNTMENFGYVFREALEKLFVDRMDQNGEIAAKFMDNKDFQRVVGEHLLKQVYEQIRAGAG